jgi:hypothetical protein
MPEYRRNKLEFRKKISISFVRQVQFRDYAGCAPGIWSSKRPQNLASFLLPIVSQGIINGVTGKQSA